MLHKKDITVGCFKVRQLMNEAELCSKQSGAHSYKIRTTERPDIPNKLAWDFKPVQPNQVWTVNITYIWVGKWVYLIVVTDLYARVMECRIKRMLHWSSMHWIWFGDYTANRRVSCSI